MIKKLVLIAIILAAVGVVAQTSRPVYITPEEARNRLVKAVQPIYPPDAEMGRIQGRVLLVVKIDEKGSASVPRVIYGHPMLIKAAINAVERSKYTPVEVAGKLTPVMTLVMVRFGNVANHDPEGDADLKFQYDDWTLASFAEEALAEGQTEEADRLLQSAADKLGPRFGKSVGWLDRMGRLRAAQNNTDEAEQYYRQALALDHAAHISDSPSLASTLADLGDLYAKQNRNDLARECLTKSLAISQKNLKNAGKDSPRLHQSSAEAVAYTAWALAKLAVQRNDSQDAKQQCGTAMKLQSFVSATDRDSLVSFCSTLDGPPPSK